MTFCQGFSHHSCLRGQKKCCGNHQQPPCCDCDSSIGECLLFVISALGSQKNIIVISFHISFFGHASSLKLMHCQCQCHCRCISIIRVFNLISNDHHICSRFYSSLLFESLKFVLVADISSCHCL